MTASDGSHLAVKIGPHFSPLVTRVIGPQDCLLYAIRHPAETVIQLTASQVDGMRPAEAVHFVDVTLRHARRVLASLNAAALVVRLEELVCSPVHVLRKVEQTARLPLIEWPPQVLKGLPADIRFAPDMDHPVVQGHGDGLATLASHWGYA